MTKKELMEVADAYGVQYKATETKTEIQAHIEEDHVQYVDYARLKGLADEEAVQAQEEGRAEVVSDDATTLIKFVGNNASLEVRNHTYTKRHPFHLVHPDDASFLVEHQGDLKGKFVIATPAQAADFYN